MGVAYLDFSAIERRPVAMLHQMGELPRNGLDARECGAVLLARTDGKQSLRSPGRLHRISEICFGLSHRSNKLADPRLEGLRRYAVAVAHDTEQAIAHEREQLVALGFSDHQITIAATTAIRFRTTSAPLPWAALIVTTAVTIAVMVLAASHVSI